MGKLVHFQADGTAIEIKLDRQRITIGRRPDNDVCLAYPTVSGEHAAVVTILSDSFLEDLGSTNGTLVNGVATTKHFLRDRDEIDIGQRILTYLVDDAATLDAPPQPRGAPDDARPRAGADATTPMAVAGVPAALRAKRRSDGVASGSSPSSDPVRPVAAPEIERAAAVEPVAVPEIEQCRLGPDGGPCGRCHVARFAGAPDRATGQPRSRTVAPPVEPVPALKVVSGAMTGRILPLVKDETLIGRTGVQVAALRRTADEVRVVPIEGANPPCVNGTPIAPDGQVLAAGDVLEIAGARLEVVTPVKPASA